MKKDRKTTPLIAAHSANKNNHKQTSAKTKSLTLDRITEGIVALDEELKYTYVNKYAGKLLGRKSKELIGERLADLESDQPPFTTACQQAFTTQTIVPFHGYFAPTDAWLEGRVYPSEDGVSVLFTDVTESKGTGSTLAKSEEKFFKAFQLSPSAMAITDSKESRIVDVNQSLLKMFELAREEILGHTLRELGITTNPDDSSALAHMVQEHGSVHDYELVIHTRDGELHYLLISIEKIEFEGTPHNLISAVDITERKRAEEKLLDISKFPGENPNPVMRFTRDGELLYANEAAAPLLAYWQAKHGQTVPTELAELFASLTDSAANIEIELEGDGKIFTCLLVPIRDMGYVNLYFRDITQRKQAEESLRALINQSTAGITRVDMDGRLTFVNQAFCEMLGYAESELIGKTIWEISAPDDLSKNQRLFERMRVDGEPYQLEKRLIRKNGSVLWATVGTSPLRDTNDRTYSAVSILADITRRKRAEQSLLETARRTLYLSSLSDTIRHLSRPFQIEIEATHALGVHLKASRVAYAEVSARETLLIRHDYVNGVENNIGEFKVSDFVPAELLAKFRSGRAVMLTDMSNDAHFRETQRPAQDAAVVRSQIVVPLVKDQQLIAALILQQFEPRDWTNDEISLVEETAERMQAAMDRAFTEGKLRESEKQFRILSNTVPSMVWATAPDGTVLYLNDHWYQYTGLSPEESVSHWAQLSLHPDDYEAYVDSWKYALATVPDEYVQEVRYRRYDGEYRWFQSRAVPARDENGSVTAWYGVSTDIHDRVEKQDELQQVINQTPFMMTRCSRDLRYRFVSRAYADMLGRTPEDMAGKPIVEIMGAEGLKTITPYVERVLQGDRVEYEEKVPFAGIGTPWLHTVYTPDRDAQGNVVGWFASITDITARKEAEQKVRARAEEIEAVLEVSPVGLFVSYDPECINITANPAGYELVQMSGQPGANISKSAPSTERPPYRVFREGVELAAEQMPMQMAARLGMDVEAEVLELQFHDGSRKFLYSYARPLFDEMGKTRGAVAAMLDITERKRMEDALQVENERFMRFVNANIIGIVIGDPSGRLVMANDYYLQLLGVTRQDFIDGKVDWKKFTPPEWLPGDEKALSELQERGASEPYEKEYVRADGTRVPVYIATALLPGPKQEIAAFVLDMTARKRNEEALHQSEERFSRFMQYLPGLAWIKDQTGRYIYANTAAEKAFNTPQAQLYGRTDDEIFAAEIASQFKRNDEQALIEGRGVQVVETLPQEDGILHHSLVTKFPIPGPDGEIALIGGTAFDITERKEMEDELLASRQRLAATYEYSPVGLAEYSIEGRFLKVNEEMCRILGYTGDELLKLTMKDVSYEEDYPAEEILYRQLVSGEIQSYKLEKRFKRKDGSLVWTQKIRSCVHNSAGKLLYTIGAILDISERKRAESRLTLLAQVSELTRTIEDPDELMFAVADTVGAHLQVKRCLFNEIDLDNNMEIVHRDYHDGIESVEGTHKITDYSNITTAEMVAGKTVVNHDSKTDPRTAHDYERSYLLTGERAYVAVPLMRDDRWVASLWVSTDIPRQWSTNDVSLLETIAERTWTATEKLRIHAALRDSEERLRVTFNTTAVGFATLALDTRFIQVNDAFCDIAGYSREELLAMKCDSLTHPDYRESTRSLVAQLISGEIPSFVLEKRFIRGDGTQIWVQNSVSLLRDADGNPLNLIAIWQDVTERKNAEDELHQLNVELEGRVQRRTAELQSANEFLRESEATSRLILESVPDAIVITNPEGVVVHCNTQVETLFGYSPHELLGQSVEILFPERYHHQHLLDRKTVGENPARLMVGLDGQIFGLRRNGEEFPVEVSRAPISNSATTWDAIVMIRDNTEQRKAQEALRVSEEKLRTLFEILPVGISFLNKNAQIIEMNSALTQILGLSKQELLRDSFKSRGYIRSDGSMMPPSEFASIRALKEQKTIYNVETGIVKAGGETIWTSVNAAPVKVADVEAVTVTVDITERKNAENALHKHRERLRALSRRLVEVQEDERRAIARELHDRVGQNLAALNLNLNILRSQLSEEALAKVGSRLTDSVQLVNDILTITRSVMADLRSNVLDDYGLASALREYADQFTQRFGVQVVTDKTSRPIPRFDPSIEMTLLRIAQEALTNVARHSQASQATVTLNMEGNAIKMTIQDNGVGILSWQKANQKGNHGLRIIRERTEALGGSVQIQSAYKKGTTIEVKIPIENDNQNRVSREKRS